MNDSVGVERLFRSEPALGLDHAVAPHLRGDHFRADQPLRGDARRRRGRGARDKIEPLWWSLSLGACLGGNGTLIGASANLTVAGIAERNGIPFRFLTYTMYAFPMMLVSIVISHVYLWWRYF
jgi:di/tricarboxylate transporter